MERSANYIDLVVAGLRLINVNNTCFANAAIQVLVLIEPVAASVNKVDKCLANYTRLKADHATSDAVDLLELVKPASWTEGDQAVRAFFNIQFDNLLTIGSI